MMNKNDYHYVMRRIITFLIISALSFFLFQSCAKANVYTHQWKQASNFTECPSGSNTCNIYANSNGIYNNLGHGYLTFSLVEWGEPTWYPIEQITVTTYNSSNVGLDYICDIGNQSSYYDSGVQQGLITAKCRVYLESTGVNYVTVYRPTSAVGKMYVAVSTMIQFETLESEANAIINANNSAIQQQINAGNTNAQAIQNAISTATQNEINAINSQSQQQHSDSQAEQQAINDNTQAINDLNDTINADYTYDPNMEDLTYFFDSNDQNIIRSLLLLPFNILGYMITILSSNNCYAVNLGSLYGTNITMPCIWIIDYIGVELYDLIDTIFTILISLGMVAYLFKVLRKVFTVSNSTCEACGVEVFK